MLDAYDYLEEDDYVYFRAKHMSMFERKSEAYSEKEREGIKNESLRD